jgi:hypothetical protein
LSNLGDPETYQKEVSGWMRVLRTQIASEKALRAVGQEPVEAVFFKLMARMWLEDLGGWPRRDQDDIDKAA